MVAVNIMTTWTWLSVPLASKLPVHLQQILWMNKLYLNPPLLHPGNLQSMSFDISFSLFISMNFPIFEIIYIFFCLFSSKTLPLIFYHYYLKRTMTLPACTKHNTNAQTHGVLPNTPRGCPVPSSKFVR